MALNHYITGFFLNSKIIAKILKDVSGCWIIREIKRFFMWQNEILTSSRSALYIGSITIRGRVSEKSVVKDGHDGQFSRIFRNFSLRSLGMLQNCKNPWTR